MRYYIYLDKELLQILFSAIEDTNFDIEVVEYSVRRDYGNSNEISIDPSFENISDFENGEEKHIGEKSRRNGRCSKASKECVGIRYGHNNSCNIQTEKRYINIEDISNMKNNAFYHKLIKRMNSEVEKESSRIVMETGIIESCNNMSIDNKKDGFFILNNNYIWFNIEKISSDINLLCGMDCKINVIGYLINCKKEEKTKNIIKAIAIFLE